ncbi:NRAMP family divalent metal transporter [cf. Phormidesmis sp. LEGE 11477]|uniref:NRAMP family divalent metal transporter n=1 Tax=cf. Phormidesmis sp. LEGE 11477 TaxID=1828680 RepID=UPI00187EC6CD|nr:divalent metal cation transporter [cf. Phormidesmis sp. LEGE 11477]MBE9064495.1 divalent metal cation transporter [cf. Phormidesmis sp. LEGE 11477]
MTSATENDRSKFSLSQIGPGLLMAGAAIGVSHLVQSTRAGAMYGWGALIFVLLANLMKYPFYEYGHRYAAASGQNLIQAYRQQGRQIFVPFMIISAISAVGSFAVDAFVAAMLLQYLWLPQVSATVLAISVLIFCWGLIAVGRYRLFEQVTKWCVILLSIATVAAVTMAVSTVVSGFLSEPLSSGSIAPGVESTVLEVAYTTSSGRGSIFSLKALPFVIAFMGWMPGGLELSVWQSLWVQANGQDSGKAASMAEASFDFNFGYVLTVVLACLFLVLGTLTLPAQGMAAEPAAFAGQLVGMYTSYIGAWAEPVIGVCAIAAIFSTTFTVVDAFPRTLEAGIYELWPSARASTLPIRGAIALILITLATLLLNFFTAGFEPLINTITIIAFVFAPFYAWLNIRSIRTLPVESQPKPWLIRLATVGLMYLSGFSLLFIVLEFVLGLI